MAKAWNAAVSVVQEAIGILNIAVKVEGILINGLQTILEELKAKGG